MILAGDIGGTNTRLALFETPGGSGVSPEKGLGRQALVVEERFPSREHATLDEIVRAFVAKHGARVEAACFGIAGPVKGGRSETTNLPWVVDARRLAGELGTERVGLVNDLEANAHGIAELAPADFHVLNAGAAGAAGNAAVISAGTGLGEAGLAWDGARHHPFASEGGHADFAPRGDLEIELWRFLTKEFRLSHVSWERVLSGPGLVNIHRFLGGALDSAAAISAAAAAGRDRAAVQALDLFVSIYGAEAGNLALKVMATGGVFVGGGIAPKILPKLAEGGFVEAFVAKGRMRGLLEAIPVRVVLNDRAALLGAARVAALAVS